MGSIKAELTTTGDLKLAGNINTRLPPVTGGLIAHFPFDGAEASEGYKSNAFMMNNFIPQKRGGGTIDTLSEVGDYIKLVQNGYGVLSSNNSYIDFEIELDIMTVNSTHVGIGFCNPRFNSTDDPQGYQWILRYYISPSDNRIQEWHGTSQVYHITDTPTPISFNNNEWYRIKLRFQNRHITTWINGVKSIDTGLSDTSFLSGGVSLVTYSGEVRFKNLHIKSLPSTNSNTTITSNGIGVEESTTNIYNNGNFKNNLESWIFGSWSHDSYNYYVKSTKKYPFSNFLRINRIASGGPADFHQSRPSQTVVGEKYTLSAWVRGRGVLEIRSHWEGAVASIALSNEWKFFQGTSTATSSGYMYFYGAGITDFLEISNVQLEQKAFATSFVNGTRSGNGFLTIESNIGTSDFTITGEFVPDSNSDDLPNGSYFLNLGNGFILSTYNNLPYINGNMITGLSGQNVHINYNATPQSKVKYIIKRDGNTFSWRMIDENGQDNTWVKNHTNVSTHSVNNLTFHHSWGGIHKNLSVYDRALSDNEIKQLNNASFNLQPNGDLITPGIRTNNQNGWTLVYEGPAILVENNTPNDFETINLYGDNYEFNEIMITAPYWDYEVRSTTNKTAKMKYSFKYYCEWLNNEPDSSSPRVKFHGTNDAQDAILTSPTSMLFGYGNDWRRITPVHYVSGGSFYAGGVPSYIHKYDWSQYWTNNNTDYIGNNTSSEIRESGTYKLTQLEFQTIQVYIRKTSDIVSKLEQDGQFTNIQNNIITGQTL